MRAKIIQIGNSKGIIIPKSLIEQYKLRGELELLPSETGLLLTSMRKSRVGWEDSSKLSISKTIMADVIGFKSRVSEIMSKKRKLSLDMIRQLHSSLNIPTEVLIREY